MHGIYAINILPHQLPYSHDVRVYGFDGGRPGTAYMPRALCNMPLSVGLAKCGHAAETFAACERHYDFIIYIPWNSPEIGSHVALSFYF